MVYNIEVYQVADRVLELFIRCQGGLYVKEFVTGDGGRTQPSVAETLGASLEVVELDVLDVE
jgi:Predicted pseudouridylate synthase